MKHPVQSPLLFPVTLKDSSIIVLDETRLPFKEEYIEVRDLEKALWVLKEMKTRSLGQVLLFFYSCVLFTPLEKVDSVKERSPLTGFSEGKDFNLIAEKFKEKRPTFDFITLSKILKRINSFTKDTGKSVEMFISKFDSARKQRAEKLADILPNPSSILTICNINGELIYLYKAMKSRGKEVSFYVSETRPYLQGSRLTFWELNRAGISCKLICDNQAGILMKENKITAVVTGADRASKRGGIINKTGTYALAVLAKHFNIPFYPLTQYPLDIDIESVEIEERPEEETFMFLEKGKYLCPSFYPSFDIVPKEYITKSVELEMSL